MCSPCSGARRSVGRLRSSNCTGTRGQSVRRRRRRSRPRRCSRWRPPAGRRAAPRPPAPAPTARRCSASSAFHSSKRARRRTRVELGDARLGVRRAAPRGRRSAGRRPGRGGRSSRQKSAQYRSASRNTSWMWRPSFVRYVADERVHQRARRPDARLGSPPWSAASTSDDSVHIAVASSDTSTTEPSPVRVRFEQRRRRCRTPAPWHRCGRPSRRAG